MIDQAAAFFASFRSARRARTGHTSCSAALSSREYSSSCTHSAALVVMMMVCQCGGGADRPSSTTSCESARASVHAPPRMTGAAQRSRPTSCPLRTRLSVCMRVRSSRAAGQSSQWLGREQAKIESRRQRRRPPTLPIPPPSSPHPRAGVVTAPQRGDLKMLVVFSYLGMASPCSRPCAAGVAAERPPSHRLCLPQICPEKKKEGAVRSV